MKKKGLGEVGDGEKTVIPMAEEPMAERRVKNDANTKLLQTLFLSNILNKTSYFMLL